MRTSEVRYARVGDDHVAYRVIESARGGDHDVVLVGSGTMSMEAFFDDAVCMRILEGLSDLGRLVVFDRRGIGLSDAPSTGEALASERWCHGVDLKTGRYIPVAEKTPHVGVVSRYVCPSSSGTKDFQPTAFSPRTGLLYIPHNNLCMDYEGLEANYIAGTPYVGANVKMYAGPGGHRGEDRKSVV